MHHGYNVICIALCELLIHLMSCTKLTDVSHDAGCEHRYYGLNNITNDECRASVKLTKQAIGEDAVKNTTN
jgi:hypothetical protein